MKQLCLCIILCLLSGCATQSSKAPYLPGQTRPTEATSPPSDFQSNDLTKASTMIAPARY